MERTCKKCGETKPIEEFGINNRLKDGHSYKCRKCTNLVQNKNRESKRDHLDELIEFYGYKICNVCGEIKLIGSFYRYHKTCKKCYNLKCKKWKENNKDKIKEKDGKYRDANKERIKKYRKEYCIRNKEIIEERGHEYYEINKEKILNHHRDYAKLNKKAIRLKQLEWARKHREYLNEKYRESGRLSDRRDTREMTDNYIIQLLTQRKGISALTIKQYPGLLETYRIILKIKRLTKNQENARCK